MNILYICHRLKLLAAIVGRNSCATGIDKL